MKLKLKYIIYLFFCFYNKGINKQIAFIKSVLCFMFLVFINITSLILFIIPNFLQSFHFSSKGYSYLFFISLFGIGYFLINKMVSEEEIKAISPNKNVRLHRWVLFFYIVLSIIFMTTALISLRHQ
ncbi:hypothetical protein [Flavobacterium sp.]|uniref:hypothetical protein n=1 Tax=Flavobacterium sp. TaxID=239 RepID=UPI0025C0C293|nr:hypothetical protein [Flavobacterium sp.]